MRIKPTTNEARGSRTNGTDAPLTYISILERAGIAVAICLTIVVPLSVHAGVLDAIFNTVSAKTPEIIPYISNESAQDMPLLKASIHTDPNPAKGGGDVIIEDGALIPSGDADGQDEKVNTKTSNGEISQYVVREGDTLSEIAAMFDVSAKTILWANELSNPSKIRPGMTLVILPITGVRHIVKTGDTLATIAKKYQGDAEEILAYNQMEEASELKVGDTVIIPDGTIAAPPAPKTAATRASGASGAGATGGGSSSFTHPAPGAVRTQGIHGYNGVDLAGSSGSTIRAAAAGQVIVARTSGWNGGYGLYVVIKHANGTQTLYAHLSSVNVAVGDSVAAGDAIGGMGNTGRSTGTHLHFEVRGARNPF